MEHELDVRGLRCPVPLLRARIAWPSLRPGDTLVVLATDPEAPIDLAAFASDVGASVNTAEDAGVWRIALTMVSGTERGAAHVDPR